MKRLLLTVSLLGACGLSSTAWAQGATVITCPECPVTITTPIVTAVEANAVATVGAVTATNTLLGAYTRYMMFGLPIPGNGIINQLAGISSRLARSNAFEQEYFNNFATTMHSIERDRVIQDEAVLPTQPSVTTRSCHDVAITRGRADAAGAALAASAGINERGTATYKDNVPTGGALAAIIKDRNLFCSEADIEDNRFGCATMGTMPDANTNPLSLFRGAVMTGMPTNQSLNEEQLKAAEAYIRNVEPMAIEQPGKGIQRTPGGAAYMVHWERFGARSQAVRHALGQITGNKAAIGSTPEASTSEAAEPFLANWTTGGPQGSFREKWEQLFPGTPFPEKPSEYDLLKYGVISLYADASLAAENAVVPEKDLVRAQLSAAATQNKLLMMMYDQMETQNMLLANLLSQELDPVSREGLKDRMIRIGTDASAY